MKFVCLSNFPDIFNGKVACSSLHTCNPTNACDGNQGIACSGANHAPCGNYNVCTQHSLNLNAHCRNVICENGVEQPCQYDHAC